jgi:glycine hydroxymethyltransferase
MGRKEMVEIADIIVEILFDTKPTYEDQVKSKVKYTINDDIKASSILRVKQILAGFVLYPEIDMDFIGRYFN